MKHMLLMLRKSKLLLTISSLLFNDVLTVNDGLYIKAKALSALGKFDIERKTQIFLFLYDGNIHHFYEHADFNGIRLKCNEQIEYDLANLKLQSGYLSSSSFISVDNRNILRNGVTTQELEG